MRAPHLLLAMALAATPAAAFAQTGGAPGAQAAIAENYRATDAAVGRRDAAAMLATRSPDFVETDLNGTRTTLPQMARTLQKLAAVVDQAQAHTELLSFRQNGSTAETTANKTYVLDMVAIPGLGVPLPPGHPLTLRTTSTDDWRYQDGRWLMVSSTITASSSQGGVASLSPDEKYQIAQAMQAHTNMLISQGQSMQNAMQANMNQFRFDQNMHSLYNFAYGP